MLTLRIGRASNPEATNAYISFKYEGATAGFIRGNGSGGIELSSSGSDYAEYLPKLEAGEEVAAGDVVGVFGGHISRTTKGADQVMVVSTAPIVVGNDKTLNDEKGAMDMSLVAFIGQAPVRTRGPVRAGDFLLPSGRDDGTAVAIDPAAIRPAQLARIVGTAWESSNDPAMKLVNAAIGIDQKTAAAYALESVQKQLNDVIERLANLESRMTN